MKKGLNWSIAFVFLFAIEIHCNAYKNDSLMTTTFQTVHSGTMFLTESSCIAFSTGTITLASTIVTVTVTRGINCSTNANALDDRAMRTETTVPYATITTDISSNCVTYVTTVVQKSTATVFVDLPAAQTTTETATDYVGTTTILENSCSTTVFHTTTVTGPASTTFFITSTSSSPIAKRAQETASFPREVIKRDLVWTTVYEPAVTIAQSVCSTITETQTILIPGQKTTVVTFVPYTGPYRSSSTSSTTSSSQSSSSSLSSSTNLLTTSSQSSTSSQSTSSSKSSSSSQSTTSTTSLWSTQTKAAVTQATPTPTPTTITTIPLQPGQTFTTTFGVTPATIIDLPGSSSALVNSATLSQGGLATTINSQVISFGPSGLVTVAASTPLSSAFITTTGSTPLSVTELPGKAVIDGTTLSSGGADITINGVVVTYGQSGLIAVSTGSGTTTSVSIGGVIMSIFGYTELGSTSEIAFGSQTLTPGGIVSFSGTVYTLPTSGTVPVAVSTQAAASAGPFQFTGSSKRDTVPLFAEIVALMFSIMQALLMI